MELERGKLRWHCRVAPWSWGFHAKCSTEEEVEVFPEPSVLRDVAGSFQEGKRALASRQELPMVQVKVTGALAAGMSGMQSSVRSESGAERLSHPNLGDRGPSRRRR